MTQLALEGLGINRLGNGQTLGPCPPSHLVWHPGDLRSICGQRGALPSMWARWRDGHRKGRNAQFCPTCIQLAAHDPSSVGRWT